MSKRVREKENEKKKDKKIKAEFKTFVLRILLPHWKKNGHASPLIITMKSFIIINK